MKNFFFLLPLVLIFGIVEAQIKVNDINAVVREAKNFQSISVMNAVDLYISQSAEESLAVSSSDPSFIPNIKTTVKDGVLKIYVDQNNKWGYSNKKIKVYVSVKQLMGLDISGACNVVIVDEIQSNSLKLSISGASNLKGKIIVDELKLDQRGASDININGYVKTLKLETSGASDLKAYDTVIDYCKAKISGASDIKITVNKEITGTVSGASTVYLKGSGDYSELKASGASSIKKK